MYGSKVAWRLGWVVAMACGAMIASGLSMAQEKETPAEETAAEETTAQGQEVGVSVANSAEAIADFEKKLAAWKEILKELRTLQLDFAASKDDGQKKELAGKWKTRIVDADVAMRASARAAKTALSSSAAPDATALRFLESVAKDAVASDNLELAAELATPVIERLDKLNQIPSAALLLVAAYSAAETGDFAHAEAYAKRYSQGEKVDTSGSPQVGEIDRIVTSLVRPISPEASETTLDQTKKLWEAELKVRAEEAAKDDLPRVKIETDAGDLLVELFENEAPETVGNFISLIEKKFYDGLVFHRVLPGFMAQGGCPKGTGTGDPGYSIYCETDKPGARKHFRGYLSMAKSTGRDTGGSQFFVTFRRTDHLDGVHTVFGRVIEGWETLSQIKKYEAGAGPKKSDPTKIITMTVVRKRDHAYEPRKVEK